MTRVPEGGEAATCAVCKTACTVGFDSTSISCPATLADLAIVCDICITNGDDDLADFVTCPHTETNPCDECTARIRAAAKEVKP